MNEEQERKISRESFKEKLKKAKVKHKIRLKTINTQYKVNLSKAKTKEEIKISKKKKRIDTKRANNKYALRHNSLVNQELYRKGVLETKIETEKIKYRKNKKVKPNFDVKQEKIILNQKIEKLNEKYKKPVSSKLRKKRTEEMHSNHIFIRVGVKSATRGALRTIAFILIAALTTTIALDIFIKPFGLYSAGLRGVTQMFYYLLKFYKPDITPSTSYILFFGANIPLAIFGYFKVGKKFTLLTLAYILTQFGVSFLLDYSGMLEHIKPFGKTSEDIYAIISSNGQNEPIYRYVLPFISTIIGVIIYGVGVGVVYKAGGSTGGSKFIVTYISAKKNKSIGLIAIVIGIFVISLGIGVNHVAVNHKPFINSYFSATIFASIIFTFVSNLTLDKMFTKTKRKKIVLLTSKKEEVIKFLDLQMMYNRSFIINEVSSGIKSKPRYSFTFISSSEEAKMLPAVFKQIDNDSFCTIQTVDKVIGKFYNIWFQ
ncbi:YitT family protein [Mycoplasma marinum]|nr:YitT family protein [Mycoplasma marinum]